MQQEVAKIPQIKRLKGRGLMLGLEFDFEIAALRKSLLFNHHIFTGAASDKKLLRILPPLNVEQKHFEMLFEALKIELKNY